MRSLYLRIWLTVLAALALFALVSGWVVQRHVEQERLRVEEGLHRRAEAWADLLERSLPPASAPAQHQAAALRDWGERLRLPMALDDAQGRRIAATETWQRREDAGLPLAHRAWPTRLDDGRTLWIARMRGVHRGGPMPGGPAAMGPMAAPWSAGPPGPAAAMEPAPGAPSRPALAWWPLPGGGLGLAALVLLLFVAVAAGAWPVVRRLTRRLEALKQGVEAFGSGALHHRVHEQGRDEIAAVAASFNRAAERVESLVRSHQSLLANASHELRSPLARLKMALALMAQAPLEQRAALQREIDANIAELDALVEEVLLASRLDADADDRPTQEVDLLPLAAEEAARAKAELEWGAGPGLTTPLIVKGEERLLRRALRNLLDNAQRYGGPPIRVRLLPQADDRSLKAPPPGSGADAMPQWVSLQVCDQGPGVPEAWRERIFEPFQRLPGHAERAGGVGLGLSLVRQIALRHGGQVHCGPAADGGSCFTLRLPLAGNAQVRAPITAPPSTPPSIPPPAPDPAPG